ncbi:MAG TPA: phytoene/squalene synthase family protein [Steroidobacteraceae bacterium]|jgi:farnesyl-diphosphate farnesyltransferase
MTTATRESDARSDQDYQDQVLDHVSRTFALTIPQLPPGLRESVTSAYLLCRIADTIEDEPALNPMDKVRFLSEFSAVVAGRGDSAALAAELTPRLSAHSSAHERDLTAHLARVVRTVHASDVRVQGAIERCIAIMCEGMHRFQRNASVRGLGRLIDLDSYCYHVAGVVGEMLTDLFCVYVPPMQQHYATLRRLAPSFGQGLQMTNILKDLWEDRGRGACWLPRDTFDRRGLSLEQLPSRHQEPAFRDGLQELIAIAHGHLRNALAFTLLIPARQTGIRRFCLWSIGLALLTLHRINDNPRFTAGAQVKVSRRAVALVKTVCNLSARSDTLLRALFAYTARGLPLTDQSGTRTSVELPEEPGGRDAAARSVAGS